MSQFEGRCEFYPTFDSDQGFSVHFVNEFFSHASENSDFYDSESILLGYLIANKSGTYAEIMRGTRLSSRQVQRLAGLLHKKGSVVKDKVGRTVVLRLPDGS